MFIFQIILFNFNLQSTATELTFNLQKVMIFSVSNDEIQSILGFTPDSIFIAVSDLVQNLTRSSEEIPLAAWQLLLSHGKISWIVICHEYQSLRTKREQWR